jgi:hypothetical protein
VSVLALDFDGREVTVSSLSQAMCPRSSTRATRPGTTRQSWHRI